MAKDLIDPTKGLSQSFSAGRASEVEQVARLDVLKAVLKNPKLDLLPRARPGV
jgi:hypothetical protein